MKLNKKKLCVCIGIVALIVVLCVGIVLVLKHNGDNKISDTIEVEKEEYKLDNKTNEIDMNIIIKNTSKKNEQIDNITVDIINNNDQIVFSFYKIVGETLKPGETYKLDISESVENSGLKDKSDIKEIKYKLNS